jgi:serpin B
MNVTEAAGATAIISKINSMPQSAEYRADHPFVFLIWDNRTSSIMFLGRLVNPAR